MKVLVVEDTAVTRVLLVEILRARGHEVSHCGDAESALERYAAEPYPLVVLDWLLPGMDGLECCRRMRALPHGDRSLVLVVTARDRPEDLRAVLEAGADDYVPKPIDPNSIDIRFAIAERQAENLRERKRAEAELSGALSAVARSRDDLLSILNRLDVGTAMADPAGQLTFLSQAGETILGCTTTAVIGRSWEAVLPLGAADRDGLRAMAARPAGERGKLTALLDGRGHRRWVEIEVHDDPRDAHGKIFVLYDVSDVHTLRRLLDEKAQFQDLVGRSKPMLQVYELIRQVSTVDASVLIEGETGTGKELVARAIHAESHRHERPFVAVNCAGLTDSILASQLFGHRRGAFTGAVEDHQGYFEAADTGTLFLDEIGDISPNVQTSLLRVLQEREIVRLGETKPRKVDVRVIAATHHDLARDAAAGSFRSDLLYRIRVARVHLPPLRERREDIPVMVSAFLAQIRAATGKAVDAVSDEAMRKLIAYPWPGNVRELKSALEYAAIRCLGAQVRGEDLPPEVIAGPAADPAEAGAGDEAGRIRSALQAANGNRSVAARLLGISRATFYRRLAELGIDGEKI